MVTQVSLNLKHVSARCEKQRNRGREKETYRKEKDKKEGVTRKKTILEKRREGRYKKHRKYREWA